MDWNLAALITPPAQAQIALIYSGPKVGKSELMGAYPGLVVLAFENPGPTLEGRKDIAMTPLVKSFKEAMDFLRFLYKGEHSFKTLGVDTITRGSRLFEGELIATPNKDGSIPKGMGDALGGYGKSYNALSEMHSKFVQACEALRRDRGMNIVWLAHSEVKKFSPPDAESYNFFGLDMHEDSASHYINNADVIGFIDQRTILREGDDGKTKVASTDQRVLKIKSNPAYVSGNRYGIKDDMTFNKGENPLLQFLKADRVVSKINPPTEAI